jgi:hypothetical protein
MTTPPAFISGENPFTTSALSPFPLSSTALPTVAPAPSARSLDNTGKRLYKSKKSSATAARTRGPFSAPASFSVTTTQGAESSEPAPFSSPLQSQRMKKSGRIPKYASREDPWLTCEWRQYGCQYTHKKQSQMNRHSKTCSSIPGPMPLPPQYACHLCEGTWTRRYRLVDHYRKSHGVEACNTLLPRLEVLAFCRYFTALLIDLDL